MTQLRATQDELTTPKETLLESLTSRLQQLEVEELTRLETLMDEHFPEGAAYTPEQTARILEEMGLTEDELLKIAEEGHASIQRGEGVSADEFRQTVLAKYLD